VQCRQRPSIRACKGEDQRLYPLKPLKNPSSEGMRRLRRRSYSYCRIICQSIYGPSDRSLDGRRSTQEDNQSHPLDLGMSYNNCQIKVSSTSFNPQNPSYSGSLKVFHT
jgi:hypothetical protein